MTVWTINKNGEWGIYADEKKVTTVDNEKEAQMLLKSIKSVEKASGIPGV